jgi:neutral ceramidase
MRAMHARALVAILVLAHQSLAHALAAEETLRVGVAETQITPPNGFPVAGYYHERLATGTHDPLKAKAIVWRGTHEQAALVVCDLTGIAVDLSTEVRRRAAMKTGIPASHIVVAATHSHTAPDYMKDLYEYLGAGNQPATKAKQPYAAKLVDGIVDAVATAHAQARPVLVDAGVATQVLPLSFNRRFVMRDGSVRTWMRLNDPEVVRPAGPIDPEIAMVLLRSADRQQPIGLLSNFALHLDTVGGTLWSADYPYYIEQALRQRLGRDVVSVFGNGSCGDINHIDPSRKDHNSTDFIGRALAKTMDSRLSHLGRVKQPTLHVRRATVRVPLQDVSVDQVARARTLLLDARAGKQVDFYDLVKAYKWIMLDQLRNPSTSVKAADLINWGLSHTWAGIGTHLPVEIHAICLGEEVAIVCLPGEIFVELGLAIKRASPFKTTLVVELCTCEETIYVPTRAAYASGSYEVTNSALLPGSGEMLVEAAIRLLREVASANHPRKP